MLKRPAVLLKQALLLFWAVWLTIVFVTNLLDAGKQTGLVAETWAFASGNYHFLEATTARYGTPPWLNGVLFAGVICWEGVAGVLFWLAWWRFRAGGRQVLSAAFTVSLMLWAAFLIADEVCIAYQVEGTHLRLFTAQLATLLAIELLPDRS
jgi:hypothetical protein